jgi:4-carboxymuconolactone decarboxylase
MNDDDERRRAGTRVRRQVLGDAHVERAQARTNALTAEFQDLITRYAWGEIWTRPGLDLRTRRVLVIGTLLALGRWEEFEMHVRAALEEGGVPVEHIKEIVLQQAIYCGVPAAHAALTRVETVLGAGPVALPKRAARTTKRR